MMMVVAVAMVNWRWCKDLPQNLLLEFPVDGSNAPAALLP